MNPQSSFAPAGVSTPGAGMGPARGMALVVAAAMLWGTTGTAQTFAPLDLSPYWIGYFRLLIASLFFIFGIALTITPILRAELAALDWPAAALAGACMAAYNLTFFAGVKAASVAIGTALAVGSAPIWAGLMQFALGRRPSGGWWLGTLVAIAGGVWLILGRGGSGAMTPAGIGLCLAAGFSYALYTLVNKRLVQRSDPRVATLVVFSVGALVALPFTWGIAGGVRLSGGGWGVVLFLGIVSTGVAYLLFSWGLRGIDGATGVSLALMEPVTAFVLAVLVVRERPQWMAYAGLALLLVGLALVMRAELRARAPAGASASGAGQSSQV